MRLNAALLLLLFLLTSSLAWAGNVMVYVEFEGNEPTMPVSTEPRDTEYCFQYGAGAPPGMLAYREAGTMQVSQAGQYRVLDLTIGWAGGSGSTDSTLHVYNGAFDPANPAQNRVAEFNRSYRNWVNGQRHMDLQAGINYTLIIQLSCGEVTTGLGGFLIRGPGEITGAGFQTPAYTYGDWTGVVNTADFGPDYGGVHKWAGNFAYTAPKSGYYYHIDAGTAWPDFGVNGGSFAQPLFYSQPFDPANPQANRLGQNFNEFICCFVEKFLLTKGQTIYIVYLDIDNNNGPYQTIIYPPGELAGINRGVTGLFTVPLQDGQGILLEADDSLNFLFGAIFTFPGEAVAVTENIGSTDQRWLTFYGAYSEDSTELNLKFENSTGGAFNAELPKATTDSGYGTGKLVVKDCDHIEVHYSLPNIPDGMFDLARLLPTKVNYCYDKNNVAEPLH